MLRKILLGLCLAPILANAEVACLEGPSGGKCHTVDTNGEVFKLAEPSTVATVTTPNIDNKTNNTAKVKQRSTTTKTKDVVQKTPVADQSTRQMSIAEQRIRQRAQVIQARFMRKQGIDNLSALNNNDSLIKRRQASSELRNRIETQR